MQAEQQSERERFEAMLAATEPFVKLFQQADANRDQPMDGNSSIDAQIAVRDLRRLVYAARAAISHPSTPQGWISVEDRLPTPWEDVLIYPRPTDYCCEGQVDHKGKWSYAEYVTHFGQETHRIQPTHWAPMPAPPEQGGKG